MVTVSRLSFTVLEGVLLKLLDLSTSSLIIASYFVVITFAHTWPHACSSRPFSLFHQCNNRYAHSIFYLCFPFSVPLFPISNSLALRTIDINCSALISLVVLSDIAAFKAKVAFLELSVKSFLQCITKSIVTAEKTMERMKVKILWSVSVSTVAQFLKGESLLLSHLRIEQLFQVLKETLSAYTNVENNDRFWALFSHPFVKGAYLLVCSSVHHSCSSHLTIVRQWGWYRREWVCRQRLR